MKKLIKSNCFLCSSSDLWSGGKQTYRPQCKGPAGRTPTCLSCRGVIGDGSINNHRNCSPKRCSHEGEKIYFSICYACYQKVPVFSHGNRRLVDWNWIVEKQQEIKKPKLVKISIYAKPKFKEHNY